MAKINPNPRATRRGVADYVRPGTRIARPSHHTPTIERNTRDTNHTESDATVPQQCIRVEVIAEKPSTRPLPRTFETMLAFYGILFMSTLASVVTRDTYLKIASYMCSLTSTEMNTRYWFRTFTRRNKHLFDDTMETLKKLPSMVQPVDIYGMDSTWFSDDGHVDLHTAPVTTKMEWLKTFLKDTDNGGVLRMLVVPYHEGLEEFVAACLVNYVLVSHESTTYVLGDDTYIHDMEAHSISVGVPEPEVIGVDAVDPNSQRLDSPAPAEGSDNADACGSTDTDTRDDSSNDNKQHPGDIPETADTEDTITEPPSSQLVIVSRKSTEEEEGVTVCTEFSDKALSYPSGDVLKLLEHTLEERTKLIMKVITMEKELRAARGG
ncbi:YALIA101S05e08790g1_1 [Yarrowia lipolytica]|nr:YALIA101S05e08790g1_1 [Yarrowia lipolytica]